MLIHEWMRYRDKHLPRAEGDEGAPEADAGEPEDEAGNGPEAAAEVAFDTDVAALSEHFDRTLDRLGGRGAAAETALRMDLPEHQSRRLQALVGRQTQLPLEVEEPAPARRGHPEPAESRGELIERLLDPILSINEAAVLCGVCPASIRRYTNRGVLKCFRTPGNQRRFRLSDVLDFMERQQREPLD